ncbi:hypothetical protein GCM10011351_29370 [Paraliobacillus quinghaiensis]|uniref:Uncharacterized protein n=1 Tax=Paraliobacillus quinghaiensis TaxID=470815 RepID=A0A917TWM6_9BACI|nr:hypothetical protein [Paraliobacillus quinghaiensis]GGM41315.1 hypothetical protein GCM10011351_29370 [Paraliobacillus quinghaiensis]
MDKNMKYIIFAFAGWLIFSVSMPAFEIVSDVLDDIGLWDFYFVYTFFRLLKFLIQIVALGTVFVFALPIILSAWRGLRNN